MDRGPQSTKKKYLLHSSFHASQVFGRRASPSLPVPSKLSPSRALRLLHCVLPHVTSLSRTLPSTRPYSPGLLRLPGRPQRTDGFAPQANTPKSSTCLAILAPCIRATWPSKILEMLLLFHHMEAHRYHSPRDPPSRRRPASPRAGWPESAKE